MKKLTGLAIATVITLFLKTPKIAAVTNPQSGAVGVTATVPALPDTPVLIAPGNNAVINTGAPSFIFNPSLGSVTINHYELWLDGAKNTAPIGQRLTTIITQAKTALSEGGHTWFIKAVAGSTSERNSATWTFTIDTTAPPLIITSVAGQQTNLPLPGLFSTRDPYPIIKGVSEAGAALTVIFGDEPATTAVGSDRAFSVKPKTGLKPGRYPVSITVSDEAGNTTSLPLFYLDITAPAGKITIPLPSPLPDLSFTVPVVIPPSLAELPTAFPLIPTFYCPINLWLILIIISLILYIIISKRRR